LLLRQAAIRRQLHDFSGGHAVFYTLMGLLMRYAFPETFFYRTNHQQRCPLLSAIAPDITAAVQLPLIRLYLKDRLFHHAYLSCLFYNTNTFII